MLPPAETDLAGADPANNEKEVVVVDVNVDDLQMLLGEDAVGANQCSFTCACSSCCVTNVNIGCGNSSGCGITSGGNPCGMTNTCGMSMGCGRTML
ncbi:hypothetical protein [Crossiella cryophila]|uniref:Uncharacterized protein n=1 Tax=Crossiella cryophila TaxID=43355 RepID=A0A7W7CEK4_9PSEU|nr:hypothetical protein [Crossiella cryophila]MBB4679665.1 hypothetical protein [Crossiella cryophila]